MTHVFRSLALPIVGLSVISGGCSSGGQGPAGPGPTVTAIQVSGPATLYITQTSAYEATDLRSNGTNALDTAASWSTDAPAVLSVTPSGQVTALTAGVAAVRADVGGVRGTAQITVVNPLLGEWLLIASNSPGNPSGINMRHKTFTDTGWEITQKAATGAVVFHHGGHYEIVGSQYTEHVDFANANTASLIGTVGAYQVQFDGAIYTQTGTSASRGTGGPLAETWTRINP